MNPFHFEAKKSCNFFVSIWMFTEILLQKLAVEVVEAGSGFFIRQSHETSPVKKGQSQSQCEIRYKQMFMMGVKKIYTRLKKKIRVWFYFLYSRVSWVFFLSVVKQKQTLSAIFCGVMLTKMFQRFFPPASSRAGQEWGNTDTDVVGSISAWVVGTGDEVEQHEEADRMDGWMEKENGIFFHITK